MEIVFFMKEIVQRPNIFLNFWLINCFWRFLSVLNHYILCIRDKDRSWFWDIVRKQTVNILEMKYNVIWREVRNVFSTCSQGFTALWGSNPLRENGWTWPRLTCGWGLFQSDIFVHSLKIEVDRQCSSPYINKSYSYYNRNMLLWYCDVEIDLDRNIFLRFLQSCPWL